MGRRNKYYTKTLHEQAYERLTSMQAFGKSRHIAKKDGTYHDKIFAFQTYENYWEQVKLFVRWVNDKYPNCKTLSKAQKYVNEWLQIQEDRGLSAYTIHLKAKALGKLYGIRPGDPNYYNPPRRNRSDIKRSRYASVNDKHFSISKNEELIKFCKATGGRRAAIEKLTSDDLWSQTDMEEVLRISESGIGIYENDGDKNIISNIMDALMTFPDCDLFVHFVGDKGGRSRFAPVISDKQLIIERFEQTPSGKKVWQHISSHADIHSYRADYAASIYKMYARNIDEISAEEKVEVGGKYKQALYICRRDEAGKRLDRAAMIKCSKALGHNRERVVADYYLYKL